MLFCVLGDSLSEAAGGDFIILHSPKFVHFMPNPGPIPTDEITPIIAAALGHPLDKVLDPYSVCNFQCFMFVFSFKGMEIVL